MNGLLNIFPTVDALALGAAGTIATTLNEAVHSRARAMIALSGGTTPRQVYGLLASDGLRPSVPWESVHVFWGDERCVPPEHPDSNFRMASEALLRYVGIPGAHIHRIRGELNPDQAALTYEEDLRREFRTGPGEAPRFDLVLLGLGDDGHTASLFPGTTALTEQQKLVTAVHIDKWGTYRVTMTFRTINGARHVLFIVSGKGKADILASVLRGPAEKYPAQLVRPVAGDLQWLVDHDAAYHVEPAHQS